MDTRALVPAGLAFVLLGASAIAEDTVTIELKAEKGARRTVQHVVEVKSEIEMRGEVRDPRDGKHDAEYVDECVETGDTVQVRRTYAKATSKINNTQSPSSLEGCVLKLACTKDKTQATLESGKAKPTDVKLLEAGAYDPVWYLLPRTPVKPGGTWAVAGAQLAVFRRLCMASWSSGQSSALDPWNQIVDKAADAVALTLTGTLKSMNGPEATLHYEVKAQSNAGGGGGMEMGMTTQWRHEIEATLIFDTARGVPVKLTWSEKIQQLPGPPPAGLPPEAAKLLAAAAVQTRLSDKITRTYSDAK